MFASDLGVFLFLNDSLIFFVGKADTIYGDKVRQRGRSCIPWFTEWDKNWS